MPYRLLNSTNDEKRKMKNNEDGSESDRKPA